MGMGAGWGLDPRRRHVSSATSPQLLTPAPHAVAVAVRAAVLSWPHAHPDCPSAMASSCWRVAWLSVGHSSTIRRIFASRLHGPAWVATPTPCRPDLLASSLQNAGNLHRVPQLATSRRVALLVQFNGDGLE